MWCSQLATEKDAVRIITAKCSEVNVVVVPASQVGLDLPYCSLDLLLIYFVVVLFPTSSTMLNGQAREANTGSFG